jgi:uncharacterized membrane protein YfcA
VHRLAGLSDQRSPTVLFAWMTALCIPVAWDAARNGQATLLVTGMMAWAVVTLARQRWRRSAIWLGLSVAVKPLGTCLLVLAALLYRPVLRRLCVVIVILAAVPFLTERPSYVISQYQGWLHMTSIGARVGADQDWAQFFGLMSIADVHLSAAWQNVIRTIAAGLTIAACVLTQRRGTPEESVIDLFVLQACFLMLFSPRTENNTYAALAPAIALLSGRAWLVEGRRSVGAALAVMAIGMAGSYEIGRRLLPGHPPTWLAPMLATAFSLYAIRRIWTSRA